MYRELRGPSCGQASRGHEATSGHKRMPDQVLGGPPRKYQAASQSRRPGVPGPLRKAPLAQLVQGEVAGSD